MSVTSAASGLWQNATTALTSPRPETAAFAPSSSAGGAKGHHGHGHPKAPSQPDQQKLNDLQSWMIAQQPARSTTGTQALTAYAATSAVGKTAA